MDLRLVFVADHACIRVNFDDDGIGRAILPIGPQFDVSHRIDPATLLKLRKISEGGRAIRSIMAIGDLTVTPRGFYLDIESGHGSVQIPRGSNEASLARVLCEYVDLCAADPAFMED